MPKPGPPSVAGMLIRLVSQVLSYWIILPYLAKGWIYIACGISTYQVDLPVEIARTHEGAHIRHRRSSAPSVGGDVVDARGIDHRARCGIVAAEDEELVDVGRIHA